MNRIATIVTGVFLAGLCAGCSGEKTVTVTGTVTLDGQPVTGGTVSFLPKSSGVPITAFISTEGTYRAESVPAGEVVVTLRPPPPEGDSPGQVIKKRGELKGEAPEPPPPPPGADIPSRYADPETSGLSTNIKTAKQGETVYDIPLTK